MKATVVDLRYRMKDVLKALERNEDVTILYHGKTRGIISTGPTQTKARVTEHPFFNMTGKKESVADRMDRLRGGRHRDL